MSARLLLGLALFASAASAQDDLALSELQVLADSLNAGAISDDGALRLLQNVIRQPGLLDSLHLIPSRVLDGDSHRVPCSATPARCHVALAFREFRDGNEGAGDSLFAVALNLASSDQERANFYYARARAGHGDPSEMLDRSLAIDPAHGPSLYARAQNLARRVGRVPETAPERAAYWCAADAFADVARQARDTDIASRAVLAATRYERAAPDADMIAAAGWRHGQRITVDLRDGTTCTTTVR